MPVFIQIGRKKDLLHIVLIACNLVVGKLLSGWMIVMSRFFLYSFLHFAIFAFQSESAGTWRSCRLKKDFLKKCARSEEKLTSFSHYGGTPPLGRRKMHSWHEMEV